MNRNAYAKRVENLSPAGRVAFSAVPISDEWTTGQIVNELRRCGHSSGAEGVRRQLAMLAEAGLIVQNRANGGWRRAKDCEDEPSADKAESQEKKTPLETPPKIIQAPQPNPGKSLMSEIKKPRSPIDILAEIEARQAKLEKAAKALFDDAAMLSSQFQTASMELLAFHEKNLKTAEALKNLRGLLADD